MRPIEEILTAAIEEVRDSFELSDDLNDYEAVIPIGEQQPQHNPDGSYTYSVKVTYEGNPSEYGGQGVYEVEVYDNQIRAECWRQPEGDCFGLELSKEKEDWWSSLSQKDDLPESHDDWTQ